MRLFYHLIFANQKLILSLLLSVLVKQIIDQIKSCHFEYKHQFLLLLVLRVIDKLALELSRLTLYQWLVVALQILIGLSLSLITSLNCIQKFKRSASTNFSSPLLKFPFVVLTKSLGFSTTSNFGAGNES